MLYVPMIIDGVSRDAKQRLGVVNPATEEVFAEVPRASQADLDMAVGAARRAFKKWRKTYIV